MSNKPKVYSTNPEALKRANPKTLTEAELAYRQMLLEEDAARLTRRSGASTSPDYLIELGDFLKQQAVEQLPPEKRPTPQPSLDDLGIDLPDTDAFGLPKANNKDAFRD